MRKKLHIIKIGGFVIDDTERLTRWLNQFATLTEPVILVHGGGRAATRLSEKLDIPVQMIAGRRVTDAQTIEAVTMVYAGLINKTMVAKLHAQGISALGVSGADLGLIPVRRRPTEPIDYGFVGDIIAEAFPLATWKSLLDQKFMPVVSSISADGEGTLLNVNADTIAHTIASGLSQEYETHLWFAFEKPGVLANVHQEDSVIPVILKSHFIQMKAEGTIHSGMIPKLENAYKALESGVTSVHIGTPEDLISCISGQDSIHTTVLI